ncbi:DUF262 domain-containing protein [Methanocalculus sp.]|uniref:GmrSD restriction endonuclease domain-containing protein n=1 Tax=Methanocalculus sp. TaxID=2004547 RepID=UPI0026242753|nr:DUF262 domain-containing protein [Methanocalculus sp.]MDG6250334.1 DUF262 domain-containing protein [Methanocalculus sp.]
MIENENSLDNDFLTEGEDEDDIQLTLEEDDRRILTKPSDPEIKSLYDKWKRGKLILQPDFQRQYVWDNKKASKLIESALMAIPLPTLYFAEESNGQQSVIDGQQRLTAFFSYLDGDFPDGKTFKLSGMTAFPELNRKTFSDLDEETQDKIQDFTVRTITILKGSDADLKFEIFERLNTGSVPLNDMEIRNCVYRGPYLKLLKELAADSEFLKLMGLEGPQKRMKDVEFVLRFAAFYHETYLRYKPSMKQFFNRDMEKYRYISEKEAKELKEAFKKAVSIINSLFGGNAFKRFYPGTADDPNGKWEQKRFNASLYDVYLGIFCDKDKNQVYQALDALREGIIDLMISDSEFIEAILIGTSEQERVKKRFDIMRRTVEDILSKYHKQPRCFSLNLKEQLYKENPTCAICGQRIQHIDDAAVDHIEQYWTGGKTIPENARLTHRYCNMARSRND